MKSLLFSQYGKNLEKAQPIPVDQVISLNDQNIILPHLFQEPNKLQILGLAKKQKFDQMASYPFNSVSRAKKIIYRYSPEQSYEPKYSPKYESIEKHIPTSIITGRPKYKERALSCQQEFYDINDSSFTYINKKQKSPKTDNTPRISRLQQISTIQSNQSPKLSLNLNISNNNNNNNNNNNSNKNHQSNLSPIRAIKTRKEINNSPDFSRYTKRKYVIKKFLPSYDLLRVNYARLSPRSDVGYVQFSKFIDKLKMRQDRSETPPSIRLQYELPLNEKSRNISLDSKIPRLMQPPLQRSKMLPYRSKTQRYDQLSKNLYNLLNKE